MSEEKNVTLKSLEKRLNEEVQALIERIDVVMAAAIHSLRSQRDAKAMTLADAYEELYAESPWEA